MRTHMPGLCRRTPRIWITGAFALAAMFARVGLHAGEVSVELASRAVPAAHEAGNGDSLLSVQVILSREERPKQTLSANGRFLVFASNANNLVANDNNLASDVFRYDRVTDNLELASVNSAGTGTGNGYSTNPTISADGSRVVFESEATDLGPAVSNSYSNIYLRDFSAGTTVLVSKALTDPGGGNRASGEPYICDTGTRVAFSSAATNLTSASATIVPKILVRDLASETTYMASLDAAGTNVANNWCLKPMLNADGSRVAFLSLATNLDSRDTDLFLDLYLRDLSGSTTYLVSVDALGTGSANRDVTSFDMNDDGTMLVFASTGSNLHALDTNTISDIFLRDLGAGATSLVSINSAGTAGGNLDSLEPSISGDGTRVAYESSSSTLLASGTDFSPDIYVREIDNAVTRQASVNSAGTGSANGQSHHARISKDGTRVAFSSSATNMHVADTTSAADLYVRDLATDTTYLASPDSSGSGGSNDDATFSVLSDDGTVVAYISEATNLTAKADAGDFTDLFVHDLDAGTTALASFALSPAPLATSALGACTNQPETADQPYSPISADGRYVVFVTDAGNLVANDNNHTYDVFRYDALNDEVVLVSVNAAGTASGNAASQMPTISADGNRVAFQSVASNLSPLDSNSTQDIFVRDLEAGVTYLASVNTAGTAGGSAPSGNPYICADGSRVAFESQASNLAALDADGSTDIFVRDIDTGTTLLASVSSAGTGSGNNGSAYPKLCADGSRVLFQSFATNLHPLATTTLTDLFVRDLAANTTYLVNENRFGTNASASFYAPQAVISANGARVAFISSATDLHALDSDVYSDIFVRDIDGGVTYLASTDSAGTGSANQPATNPSLSADGKRVAFECTATNLHPVATAINSNIFVRDLDSETTYLATVQPSGSTQTNGPSYLPTLSADGNRVAFRSSASDLHALATSGKDNAYVRDLSEAKTYLASTATSGLSGGNAPSDQVFLGAYGLRVVFRSSSTNLDALATDGDADIFVATVGAVDIEASVAESADPVTAGSGAENLTYTVTVANNGPSNATGLTLDVAKTLPTGVTVASTTASGSTSFDGSTWTVGALANGDSETLTIKLTVAANAAAGTDVVQVQASLLSVFEGDTDSTNDSDSNATSIVRQSDLVVTKLDDGAYAAPDKVTVYTISVENFGPSDAANVVITETVPAGTVYSAGESETGWNVSGTGEAGDTCTFDAGSLAAGDSIDVAFAVLVEDPLSGVSGEIENTASAASDSTEENEGDESDSVSTFLVPHPVDDIDGDGIPNDEDKDDDGDGVKDAKDPDRDGDGVNDDLDPDPNDPTVVGPGGLAGVAGLSVKKLLVKLDFDDAGKDKIAASGIFVVPEGFDPDGKSVDVDVGGQTQSFTLDENGKGITGEDRFKIKASRKPNPDGTFNAKWALSMKKGTFAVKDVNDAVFDGTSPGEEDRVLRMTLNVEGAEPELRYNVGTAIYKSTDIKGSAKSKKP